MNKLVNKRKPIRVKDDSVCKIIRNNIHYKINDFGQRLDHIAYIIRANL